MISDCDLAWAAGLFEGEGCITFEVRDGRACLRLKMTDGEPVRRFAEVVGYGKVYGPYKHGNPFHSPYLVWYARRGDALAVFDLLAPWLSARRLARGEQVRELQRTARHQPGMSGWARQRRKLAESDAA